MTILRTNQDLDPDRLGEAFGIFPSGVVTVAALVDGATRRPHGEFVHLGQPQSPARVDLHRQHDPSPLVFHRSRFGRLHAG